MSHQGKYPVIDFPLKDIGDHSLQKITEQLKSQIHETFMSHHYLKQDPALIPQSYWVNSGSRVMLEKILRIGFTKKLADKAAALIIGKEQEFGFVRSISLIRQYENENGKYRYILEELSSHLLFYEGYLTATSCNKLSCVFVTPNYEVREEFQEIIMRQANLLNEGELDKEDLEVTGIKLKEFEVRVAKIEFVLNYESKIAAVNAVMKHDIEALNTVITKHTPQLPKSAVMTNLNLLQLAAISGNGKIFERVLDYCGKSLLDDKKAILSAGDFAYMSQEKEVLNQLDKPHELSLKNPSIVAPLICWSIADFAIYCYCDYYCYYN
ncbi:MAG: putative protein conserved in bacteria [Candidatus Midichloria mitochondrii]|nr:hypothetical protein [Candidatus Midichloria mitochondrii]MDJ1288565.1 hypothetical protein [Candidatus Midichloria mitochondrii]MDJ1299414.1 hypothetical protein [Candidatus Midichloria mitochondrii]MDJ1313512.1 hypothetical protein [Candidatus Midichloria mitochondrii]MDJ1584044.1 hypothetical protein [Candidatus Midichloria mitochondrii]